MRTAPTDTRLDSALAAVHAAEAAAEAAASLGAPGAAEGHKAVRRVLAGLALRIENGTDFPLERLIDDASGVIARRVRDSLWGKAGAAAVARQATLALAADGDFREGSRNPAVVWSLVHPERSGACKAALVLSFPSAYARFTQTSLDHYPETDNNWNGDRGDITARLATEEIEKDESAGWELDCAPKEVELVGRLSVPSMAWHLAQCGHPLPGWL